MPTYSPQDLFKDNRIDSASVKLLTNDQIVIRLLNTISHLSRWLSPVHDRERLFRTPHRNEPTVRDLLIRLREEEQIVFPKLYAIATENRPDLDRLPKALAVEDVITRDRNLTGLQVMAECRRLRQSTTSLLRSLPDVSWRRVGISRADRSISIRELADDLTLHDQLILGQLDRALTAAGAREGIAQVSQVGLAELQRLSPAVPRD